MVAGMKPGDWMCPNCGDHQFARNSSCRACGGANSGSGGKGKGKGKGKTGGKMEMMQKMMQMMMGGGGGGDSGCKWCAMNECWTHGGGKGGGGKGVKEGDWLCPGCGDHQFARNDECRKCSTSKPSEGLVQRNSSARLCPGDWICPSCGDHQFARNEECKQCNASKPADCAVAKHEMKDGDWMCPDCEDHQFAKNTECRKCGAAHPEGGGDSAPKKKGKGSGKGGKKVKSKFNKVMGA